MNELEQKCKELLKEQNVDMLSEIDFDVNGKVHTLSYEYIIDTFMKASDESQLVFFTALKKATQAQDMGIEKFFEGMGQLLLMTHLSNKI